jgi:F-type H+-transporting ATPase subunit alpha
LFAINNGTYDDISVEKALAFESGFLSYSQANCAEMLARVEASGELSKDDEQVLVKALNEFKTTFAV